MIRPNCCMKSGRVLGPAGAEFVAYFRAEKSEQIYNCLLLEKRRKFFLGLDDYTQNANECANSVIKRFTDGKLS